ncbi:ATP-binding protein [Streptomyces avicenniae]|uniref:ATP-binding protein n=1 Tax=Streptomyces avicenniae TaxID=500153 RepID=UPI000AF7158A|nr:ATP-binding protein [Streptomyces avicenniae]
MYDNASIPTPVTHGPGSHAPHLVAPFPLYSAPRFGQCPPPAPDLAEPSPTNLLYALTLPSASGTPDVAQESAEVMFDIHGVEDELLDPSLRLVHELAIHACRFTGAGQMIHLALRRTRAAFEITAHDMHAAHTHRHLAAVCDKRRTSSLAEVRDLVDKRLGAWGYAPACPPAAGTSTWATLPHPAPTPDTPADHRIAA